MSPDIIAPTPSDAAVPAHDHAYFFLGNCQMQYLCSMIGAVTTAGRYLLGHPFNVNVSLDGAPVPYVRGREFLAAARAMRAQGGRTILLVQETQQRRYHERIGGWGDLFTDILLVPHLHHRSVWPGHALDKPIEQISDHSVRRLFDWERHEFRTKLVRCGVDPEPFAEAYWARNLRELRFYHPGHPTGELFAEVLKALGPGFSERLPCLEALLPVLDRSLGIYQTCSHPIHPRAAALLNVEWTGTPFYEAWSNLRLAEPEQLRPAVDRASEILNSPEELNRHSWPLQAHFRSSVASANLQLGRRGRALRQLQQASIELKGFHPVLRIALNQAMRAGRFDMIEHTLVEVAPFMVRPRAADTGIGANLKALFERGQGHAALKRVLDRVAPGTWMHETLQDLGVGA